MQGYFPKASVSYYCGDIVSKLQVPLHPLGFGPDLFINQPPSVSSFK